MEHVGMDVHKNQTQICLCTEDGEIREERIRTSRERFTEWFRGRPRARVLLESSTESEWVARCIEGLGHEVIVADPNYAPMYAHRDRRVKTDRRDAQALMEACRRGTFLQAHRLSDARREVRAELAAREVLVRTRTRTVSLVRALVRGEGLRVKSCATEAFLERLADRPLPEALRAAVAPLVRMLELVNREIAEADRRIGDRAASDPVARRLCTAPGVGPVTAMAFVSVVDEVSRFPDAHKLQSYVGLVPREWSSGEKQRRGPITKSGNTRMRSLLVQGAWVIWRSKSAETASLRTWVRGIEMRRGRKVAVVGLARRLAGILYAMWRDGTDYSGSKVGRTAPLHSGAAV